MQLLLYVLAVLGSTLPAARRFTPIAATNTFVMLNAAAAVAFYKFITGRKVAW
jgi:poly-beta-1,6-N-acetyl-D-glucosamine synthase